MGWKKIFKTVTGVLGPALAIPTGGLSMAAATGANAIVDAASNRRGFGHGLVKEIGNLGQAGMGLAGSLGTKSTGLADQFTADNLPKNRAVIDAAQRRLRMDDSYQDVSPLLKPQPLLKPRPNYSFLNDDNNYLEARL